MLIDNSIQTLQSRDINGTITRLNGPEQEIGAIPKNNENYASVQVVLTLLLTDVIKSLDNGDNSDNSKALIYLNLAEQELGRILLYTSNSQNIPPGTLLTYSNYKYKIRINCQYDWIIDGYSYPTGAGGIFFYLPDIYFQQPPPSLMVALFVITCYRPLPEKMAHCNGRCLVLAIAKGKVGEDVGDGINMRKYCAICEIYFGLSVQVTRCPCCNNLLRCPLRR